MKQILLFLSFIFSVQGFAQYIGVKAKYTETRLVDDSPNPPKRQNRLILSFYEVSAAGIYTPVSLTNYDLWVYKEGLQYGSLMGGVQDSAGNNYPNYTWTAPRAVSYYSSYLPGYIDCDPSQTTHYVVNGQELDCGFVGVSYWDIDYGTGQPLERFTAPNICLPYYFWPDPLAMFPGNLNFNTTIPPTAPYNLYNFDCGGIQQQVIRGILQLDSSLVSPLPVNLTSFQGEVLDSGRIRLQWTNLTESEVDRYELQKALPDSGFELAALIWPSSNNGSLAAYTIPVSQTDPVVQYRLKIIEQNGTIVYSPVIQVKLPAIVPVSLPDALKIYPNPVQGVVLSFTARIPKGPFSAELFNIAGQHITLQLYNHPGGTFNYQLAFPARLKGWYYLQIRTTGRSYNQAILINP